MKKLSKKIVSSCIAMLLLISMLVCSISTSAVTSNLIDVNKKGSLTIHKYEMEDISLATVRGNGEETTDIPETAIPYADVTFKLTRVADLVTNGKVNKTYYTTDGIKLPTPSEAKEMSAIATYTKTTDSNGEATFTDLPLGIYLVQETHAPSQTVKKVADFVVSIPMTDSTGTAWNYNVHAYPKNETTYAEPVLVKTDVNTGEALEGAKFNLYTSLDRESWTLVESGLTTDSNGKVQASKPLPTSAYYMWVETQTPDSEYVLDTDFQTVIWISADSNICNADTKLPLATTPEFSVTNNKPTISKAVSTNANKTDYTSTNDVIYNVGTTIKYSVDVRIPVVTDMSSYDKLQVWDTLPTALTIDGTPTVSTANKTYINGVDFYYSYNTSTNKFTIDINAEKFENDGTNLNITIDYTCTVNSTLVNSLGTALINTATIKYSTVVGNNEDNPEEITKPEEPEEITSNETEVHTSGFEFKKVNPNGEALEGAKFKIYTSLEDAKNGTNAMSFMDKNGNIISEAVSGADGLVTFNGLGYGAENTAFDTTATTSYWIVETYAPNGYNLLAEPFEVEVGKTTFTYNSTSMNVENHYKTELPMTGGYGSLIFYAIGISSAVIGVGVYFLFFRKKSVKNTK